MDVQDFGPVRVLTFDRPEKLNALDIGLAERGLAAFDAAADDENVAAVVLTGSGRGFCAGVDLDYLQGMADGVLPPEPSTAFCNAVRHFPKPVIGAVNGMAVGVGTTLCLHMDLTLAAESARFRTPFTKIGVGPEIASSYLLPRLIGHQRANWMLLSSAWVDASTAAEWGLAFEMVPDAALIDRAVELGTTIAANDAASIAATKRTVRFNMARSIAAAEGNENVEFKALQDRLRT